MSYAERREAILEVLCIRRHDTYRSLRQTGAGGRYFGSHFRWASCAGANGGGVEPVVGGTAP